LTERGWQPLSISVKRAQDKSSIGVSSRRRRSTTTRRSIGCSRPKLRRFARMEA
jgi:hypothetical protein